MYERSTPGNYLDELRTIETIDKEGWIHSENVGHIMENGAGRKIFLGEYIVSERLEVVYANCKKEYGAYQCFFMELAKIANLNKLTIFQIRIKNFIYF